ncbi:hypothetical protein T12_686 [Trichinella patagoniensis]|uniref:MULE transposase domain-containing protein n=1 Tax=Trichinella patagoniensis TaxID=990121 RepID=A0A0V0ZAE2_9BILA|nr:hypothetical protein T12_686 [Trichinella patagoniensis]
MCTKRAENFPRLPLTPQQLEILAHWQLSKSGRHFIWYSDAYNFILIFCTEENLNTLSEHSVLSMDETLKIVPEWYQRLFTIHVFMAGKISLIRQTIISDFQTALIPAVQGSFPGVHVQGCYFHFCQAVLRKVADLELRTRYLHEAETKKRSKC